MSREGRSGLESDTKRALFAERTDTSRSYPPTILASVTICAALAELALEMVATGETGFELVLEGFQEGGKMRGRPGSCQSESGCRALRRERHQAVPSTSR